MLSKLPKKAIIFGGIILCAIILCAIAIILIFSRIERGIPAALIIEDSYDNGFSLHVLDAVQAEIPAPTPQPTPQPTPEPTPTPPPLVIQTNGRDVHFRDFHPLLINNQVFVPVRGVFEQLDFIVNWDNYTKVAMVSDGTTTAILEMEQPNFTVNGTLYSLPVPAQIINENAMLPLLQLAQRLGFNVSFDAANYAVSITDTEPEA